MRCSSTLNPDFRIWSRSNPGPSSRWRGMDSDRIEPSLSSTAWLPVCRETTQPAFSNALTASAPEMRGTLRNGRDLDLPQVDREGKARVASRFKADRDRVADVGERL